MIFQRGFVILIAAYRVVIWCIVQKKSIKEDGNLIEIEHISYEFVK